MTSTDSPFVCLSRITMNLTLSDVGAVEAGSCTLPLKCTAFTVHFLPMRWLSVVPSGMLLMLLDSTVPIAGIVVAAMVVSKNLVSPFAP